MTVYLHWMKSVLRRLRRDMTNDLLRQEWWARGVSISPMAIINTDQHSILDIGRDTVIGPYTVLDMLSDPMASSTVPSILCIGERTAINEFNNIRVGGSEIVIGNDCLISQYVSIIGTNHSMVRERLVRDQFWNTAQPTGIRVGNDVWIGTHAVILPGVQIGTGAVVAAGAIVTQDVPDYAVVAGVPATVKKYRE